MLQSAIILAGGKGTRLQSLVSDLPKPMAEVNGRPFLNYQLAYLRHYGIERVYLSIGHLANNITDYYGSKFEDIEIVYCREENPLGTGGGIRMALEKCLEKECFVLNGDSFFDVDLNTYYTKHLNGVAQHSLALRRVEDASRYGTIVCDKDQRLTEFIEKSNVKTDGLINAGTYILNRELFLQHTPANTNFSIEKDYFEKVLRSVCIKGFVFEGYFIDIGIPEDYLRAQDDFKRFAY